MLIHSVYFWFKPDADAQVVARFEDGLRRLVTIPEVREAYFGPPEAVPARAVVDQSYAWALVERFDSVADHDAYQAHPIHEEFLETFKPTWDRVQVFDVHVQS
jgi:hypothetical protein